MLFILILKIQLKSLNIIPNNQFVVCRKTILGQEMANTSSLINLRITSARDREPQWALTFKNNLKHNYIVGDPLIFILNFARLL